MGDTPLSMVEEGTSLLDVNLNLLEKIVGQIETRISTTIAKEREKFRATQRATSGRASGDKEIIAPPTERTWEEAARSNNKEGNQKNQVRGTEKTTINYQLEMQHDKEDANEMGGEVVKTQQGASDLQTNNEKHNKEKDTASVALKVTLPEELYAKLKSRMSRSEQGSATRESPRT